MNKEDIIETLNIRPGLAFIREKWKAHTPTSPICLDDEVEPGITISEFCVFFLQTQRTKRVKCDQLPSMSMSMKEGIASQYPILPHPQ